MNQYIEYCHVKKLRNKSIKIVIIKLPDGLWYNLTCSVADNLTKNGSRVSLSWELASYSADKTQSIIIYK